MSRVLVTGGSGFIASHCILGLLAAGHRVRATVRNLERAANVREVLEEAGRNPALSFAAADLERDEGWQEAVDGNEYVLHVASPFPAARPDHEDDLIVPAREGTLRVLRAARAAGVRRVVHDVFIRRDRLRPSVRSKHRSMRATGRSSTGRLPPM